MSIYIESCQNVPETDNSQVQLICAYHFHSWYSKITTAEAKRTSKELVKKEATNFTGDNNQREEEPLGGEQGHY